MTGYHLHSLLTEILSKNIDIEFNDKDTIHSIKGKIGNIIEEISEPSEHSNEEDYYLQDYDLN